MGQYVGHVARYDALGQPFGNSRLAYAGLTDEDGVVFRTAAQNLDDPFDFPAPTDDRVDLILPGQFVQIAAKFG